MSVKFSPGSDVTIIPPTRSVKIDEVDVEKHGLNMESFMVDLTLDSFGFFSIVFAGADSSADGIAWMDDDLFTIGRKVAIQIGAATLIVGEISNVRANFPSSGTPSIEIIGDDSASFVTSKKRRRAALTMRYGHELLSFNWEMDRDSLSSNEIIDDLAIGRSGSLSASKRERKMHSRFILDSIEKVITIGSGECTGSPDVVPGRTLVLEGLGTRSSGPYRLIGSIHTMDQRQGYRTTFMAMTK